MRKILFIIPLVLFVSNIFAQAGIGTASPLATFEVAGSIATGEGSLIVASDIINIPLDKSVYKLTGSPTANFDFNFSTTPHYGNVIPNGQRIVIYNDTDFAAKRDDFIVQPKSAQEFIHSSGKWYSIKSSAGQSLPKEMKWFYAPSLVLNMNVNTTGNKTVNVYENYKKQFTGSSTIETGVNYGPTGTIASIPVFAAAELDYVITGYDKSVFSNVSINDAGVLTYRVIAPATDKTFMNIILVPKK